MPAHDVAGGNAICRAQLLDDVICHKGESEWVGGAAQHSSSLSRLFVLRHRTLSPWAAARRRLASMAALCPGQTCNLITQALSASPTCRVAGLG